jgi:hypothetical protein
MGSGWSRGLDSRRFTDRRRAELTTAERILAPAFDDQRIAQRGLLRDSH